MEAYVTQLIEDIESTMHNVPRPYIPPEGVDFWDVPTPEEEKRNAPVRQLEELTGISDDQLPLRKCYQMIRFRGCSMHSMQC